IRRPAGPVPLVSKSYAAFTLVSFGIQFRSLLPSCTSINCPVFPQSRPDGRQVETPAIPGDANGFASHSPGLESAVVEDPAVRGESLVQQVGWRGESKR